MSTISFSGLSSGMDTAAIIKSLMDIERQPEVQLEANKALYNNKLSAYKDFNKALSSLWSSVGTMDSTVELQAKAASLSKSDFFTASAASTAVAGSYQLKAHSLAQVEKVVSGAGLFADTGTTLYKTGTMALTVDGTTTNITIDSSNNTLSGMVQAINNANAGVKATIISDGAAANPYRIVLTADAVPKTIPDYDGADNIAGNADDQKSITLDTSGLTGSGAAFSPGFSVVQEARQAHITVDTVDIYSNSNTFTSAVAGVTLTLNAADLGATTTTLKISQDTGAIKSKVSALITAYNEVMKFVNDQAAVTKDANGNNQAGPLNGDAGVAAVKRQLQAMLTAKVGTSGALNRLSQLGLETQKDGTLELNNSTLDSAIANKLDDVVKLLAGEGTGSTAVKGIATRFEEYLASITSSTDGLLAGRSRSYTAAIKRVDNQIADLEARLTKREQTYKDQFNALEKLVSVFNSQSTYLTQQMNAMSNLWSKK